MPVKPTVQIGHAALRAFNRSVSNFSSSVLQQLITDLRETMIANGLIGMAAPQIAENVRLFITEPRETETRPKDQTDIFRVYINPSIVDVSKEQHVMYEGCGSVLNGQLFGPVQRPKQVTIEAYDERGQKFRLTADGILGRVILHEFDHVEGELFLEKVTDPKQLLTREYYIEMVKSSPELKQAGLITTIKYEQL